MTKLVKDVMHKQPKVITPDEPLHKAAAIMHKHDISHLPVVDDYKRVVGHVHTNDVLKAVSEQKAHTLSVKEIMQKPPLVLPENTPIPAAANMMAKAKVKGAPTINDKGELSGFIHARDIEEKVSNGKPHADHILNATKHNPKRAA